MGKLLAVVALVVLACAVDFGLTTVAVWGVAALTGWYVFSWKIALAVWVILAVLQATLK